MTNSNVDRSRFTVIDGGAQPKSKWLTFPRTIIARSMHDKDTPVTYRASRENANRAIEARRFQPVLEFYGCVAGQMPHINGLEIRCQRAGPRFQLMGIADAKACFRGVKRPAGEDDRGFDFLGYASKPRWSFAWDPDSVSPVGCYEVRDDLVFMTFVRLDPSTNEDVNWRSGGASSVPSGVITHWGFYEADPLEKHLPIDHKERFRRRMW